MKLAPRKFRAELDYSLWIEGVFDVVFVSVKRPTDSSEGINRNSYVYLFMFIVLLFVNMFLFNSYW